MRKADYYFKENLKELMDFGYGDENPRPKWGDSTPAYSLFTTQVFMKYNITRGELPITLARKIPIINGNKEMDWIYLEQSNELALLREKYGITWWDDWNVGDDTIGQRYGATVKKYNLMNELLDGIKKDPFGRRHIINLWQNDDFKTKGLNPCAFLFMITVYKTSKGTFMDATLVQRSSDFAVAGHINQMQYLGLAMRIAKHFGYQIGKFGHFIQNFHVYDRHLDNIYIIQDRLNSEKIFYQFDGDIKYYIDVPDGTNFYDITWKDFKLENYNPIVEKEEEVKLTKFELAI